MQLSRWDCGMVQYRSLMKEHAPNEWKAFKDALKALGNKLRPMVYQLGFLKDSFQPNCG